MNMRQRQVEEECHYVNREIKNKASLRFPQTIANGIPNRLIV
jgi:hypothetical protein